MKKFLKMFLIIAILGLFIGNAKTWGQFLFFDNPMIGKKANDFTLRTARGGIANTEIIKKGKPTIMFFWATWCPHCRKQIKELNDNLAFLNQKGFILILVDVGEEPQVVRKYLDNNKISLDSLLDLEGLVADEYNVLGMPTFYLINSNGIIKAIDYSLPQEYEKILLSQ